MKLIDYLVLGLYGGASVAEPVSPAFYVDATLGDDANPGTQALPWQTVAKVNAETFAPGDTIVFLGTFREKLIPPSSGESGSPITLDLSAATIRGDDLITEWAASTVDQSQVEQTTVSFVSINLGNTDAQMRGAQSFTTTGAIDVTRVDVLGLRKTGTPADGVQLHLYTSSTNKPGTLIATSATTVPGSALTTIGQVKSFVFATPVTLSATTKYFFVLTRTTETADSSNYYATNGANGSVYAGGGRCTWTLSTTTWGAESATVDIGFQVFAAVAVANVYSAAIAWSPRQLWRDDVRLTPVADTGDLASDGQWIYSGGLLYVYATSDPALDTIEASRRNGVDLTGLSYLVLTDPTVLRGDDFNLIFEGTSWCTVSNCIAQGSGNTSVFISDGSHHLTFTGAAGDISDNGRAWGDGDGIGIGQNSAASHDILIENLPVHDNGHVANGHNIAVGATSTGQEPYNIIVAGCSLYNATFNGVEISAGQIEIDSSLIYNNAEVGVAAFPATGQTVDVTVQNCTVWGNIDGINATSTGGIGTIAVKNCIVAENNQHADRGCELSQNSSYGGGNLCVMTSDYNVVYNSSRAALNVFGDNIRVTWADWLTNSGQDANSLNTDPLFTNAGAGDFTLTGYSPAINAGTDAGLTEDYAGNAVPYVGTTSVADIGAYEYQGDLAAPVAGFSIATLTGDAPFTVQIIDASVGAVAWAYTFGVEGTSEEQNPQYTFNAPGTYSIRQTVFNNDLASDELLRTDYITVTAAAVPGVPANLSAGATNGVVIDRTPTYTADAVATATAYDFQRNTAADETGATLFADNPSPQYTELSDLPLTDHYVRTRATNGDGAGIWSSWLGFTVVLAETVMTQSLGAELLANPDFTTWASAHPSSWTRAGEVASDPLISEVAAGGGAGTGAAKFYSSATLNVPTVSQSVLTIGGYIERVLVLSQRTSGIARLYDGAPTASRPQGLSDPTAAATYRIIDKNISTSFRAGGLSSAPIDLVVDSVSAKVLTPNATHIIGADGVFQINYTLPPTPDYREMIMLQFRAGDDSGQADWLNHWRVMVYYTGSAWNARLEKVVAGTVTNVKAQAGIGANDSLRVTVSGNDITATWGLAGTYSGISTAASDAALNTNTRARVIYTSHFSAVALFAGADAADFPVYTGTAWHVDQTSIVTPPTGSAAAPFVSLKEALENAALVSGDQVILHGVVLVDNETVNHNANGITVKPPDGEYYQIHLDNSAWIYVNGDDNFWLELDIDGIDPDRTSAQAGSSPSDIGRQGFYVYGQRNTVRNRMITNVKNSGTACYDGAGLHVYGGVISHNGWYSTPDAAYHGHNHFYVQNNPAADTILFEQTIVANGFNDNGKIGGTAAAENSEITVRDVIYLDGEIYCSWASAAQGIVFQRLDGWNWRINIPVVVSTPQHSFSLIDCVISSAGVPLFMRGILAQPMSGNKLARRGGWLVVRSVDTDAQVIVSLTANNNAYYTDTVQDVKLQTATASRTLAAWQATIGQDAASTAQSSAKLPDSVTVTQIAALDRCLVSIHNENALATSVNVDLSDILTLGEDYIVRQGQDCRGDTFTITNYDGSPTSFDMTAVGHSVATPIGLTAFHTTSFPYFGTFYVEKDLPTP